MTKYIISSGTSVISELLETGELTSFQATTKPESAISYDTIGEAMLKASKVNNVLGLSCYRAMSIEV